MRGRCGWFGNDPVVLSIAGAILAIVVDAEVDPCEVEEDDLALRCDLISNMSSSSESSLNAGFGDKSGSSSAMTCSTNVLNEMWRFDIPG